MRPKVPEICRTCGESVHTAFGWFKVQRWRWLLGSRTFLTRKQFIGLVGNLFCPYSKLMIFFDTCGDIYSIWKPASRWIFLTENLNYMVKVIFMNSVVPLDEFILRIRHFSAIIWGICQFLKPHVKISSIKSCSQDNALSNDTKIIKQSPKNCNKNFKRWKLSGQTNKINLLVKQE